MCFYLIHGNQHSHYPKNYKNKKLGKEMEGGTVDSTAQGSKEGQIELISRKF